MEHIFKNEMNNKTVLEIGTGRGGTTRELVKYLSKFQNCTLITTDIADDHFQELKSEFQCYNMDITFIKTDACVLENIENDSVDYVICNYALCAINSKPGCEVVALKRFYDVLKYNGCISIEEEFPITHMENEMQEIWARKWRILKSCTCLLGNMIYNEMEPETLKTVLNVVGFENMKCETDTYQVCGTDCLEFFFKRLNKNLQIIGNAKYEEAMKEICDELQRDAAKALGMEIPTYRIIAYKY